MQPQKKSTSTLGKIAIGITVLLVLCCGMSIVASAITKGTPGSSSSFTPIVMTTTTNGESRQTAPTARIDGAVVAVQPTSQSNATATRVNKPTDTSQPAGSSKDNPAPLGTEMTVKEFRITVNKVVRPADKIVAAGNMFNQKPESDQEYTQIFVTVLCNQDSKLKCHVSPYDFKASGSNGIVADATTFVTGVDGMLETTDLYGGARLVNKSLFFLVGKGETNVVLEFQAGLLFQQTAYFAIPNQAP
ncbi:MAG TPA: hypothetical protein VGK87_03515 [Anaerolineae bacterium]